MYKLMILSKPTNKKYKFQAELYNTKTQRTKVIKFGSAGMGDYTIYNAKEGKKVADEHKRLYILRHKKRENWTKSGIDTAGWWSKNLLWSKPTLQESFDYIMKKYKL